MRRHRLILLSLALTLAVPIGASGAAASPPKSLAQPELQTRAAATTEVLASGLRTPWGIAPLPDGGALVTERDTGQIWRVKPGTPATVIYTVREAAPWGEGGLLGIALAPDFRRSKAYYVYYTTPTDNRVARLVLHSSARPQPIVTGIPKAQFHNGGALYYKSGGYLYIGTGDNQNGALAQDPTSLAGKILKVNGKGEPAPGNKWGLVFTMGHRNVQDLVFDPSGSRLWATELGENTYDELNRIVNGRNYGWPECEGVCNRAGFTDPKLTWHPSVASPSGITWAQTPSGPRFYVAALRGQRVWRINIDGATVSSYTSRLIGSYGRIRGVQGRGAGSLWVMTSNGNQDDRIIRIVPAP